MRYAIMSTLMAGAILIAAAGCGKDDESTDNKPQEKSVVDKTVEDVTGITTIREGEKAKDRIRTIQADRQRQYEEAMGEE